MIIQWEKPPCGFIPDQESPQVLRSKESPHVQGANFREKTCCRACGRGKGAHFTARNTEEWKAIIYLFVGTERIRAELTLFISRSLVRVLLPSWVVLFISVATEKRYLPTLLLGSL